MNCVAHEILGEDSIWNDNVMYKIWWPLGYDKIWWPLGYDNGLNQM